jgi:hypothetical protein
MFFFQKLNFLENGLCQCNSKTYLSEITLPAIQPVFPGATIPKGSFNNNFTLSGFEAAAKAKPKF